MQKTPEDVVVSACLELQPQACPRKAAGSSVRSCERPSRSLGFLPPSRFAHPSQTWGCVRTGCPQAPRASPPLPGASALGFLNKMGWDHGSLVSDSGPFSAPTGIFISPFLF